MATTPIKDVGSLMNLQAAMGNMAAGAAGAAKNAGDSFQSVLNQQTGAEKQDVSKSQAVKEPSNKAKPGDDLRAKNHTRKDVRTEKPKTEMSEEDVEKAAEVVAATAGELMTQIADTFGMTVEELQNLMTEMDLEPVDLLNPEQLSAFLLQASGAQDSMTLLTNEALYSDYQMLMDQAKEMTEAIAQELAIAAEPAADVTGTIPEIKIEDLSAEDTSEAQDEEPLQMAGAEGRETIGEQPVQKQAPGAESHKTGADSGSAHSKQAKSEVRQDGEGNLVLQTIKDQNFAPEMEAVQASAGGSEVDTQDIMRQIMDYMRVQIRPDATSMEMQLHPASLGTLQIQVEAKGGVLTANFITQNEAVKAALESQMVQLQENFENQGIKVEAIEVTVATHQFEQNLDQQGRNDEQSGEMQESRRSRVRRINLSGADGMPAPEDMENMEEEDRIAAEMLAANGGTVDYTA